METLQFVSHELNSPLSSILNYAYMLRQGLLGPLTEKQTSALDVVSGNLKHVMEMIRHYLNLARIESGEIQPVPARVAVREEVIAPILASLQAEMHAKNLRVEDLIGPKVILQADLNMTREVFENLLGNAVKYGRAGGLITLNCRCNGAWAEFSIRNEGEGIPPERRGELFQKFSRIEAGDSKKARRGTGLGLFISKKIVEAHGGTILAESEVGHWTEFRCTLPLARDSHPAESRDIGEVQAT
jgi:signal transduction histidine kinase